MPNPKRKHSKSRRDKRRSANSKLCGVNLSVCPQCKKPRLPHRVCPHCGYYNGKPIIIREVKEDKKK
jgi:large subunit ribosomal protein L32